MLLRDLLNIFRGDDPLVELGREFSEMLGILHRMFSEVNPALWNNTIDEDLVKRTQARDARINKLECELRSRALNHLAVNPDSRRDIPYCFVLINVVKDAERVGDYIKNLVDLPKITGGSFPDGPHREALIELGRKLERMLFRLQEVFPTSDTKAAEKMVREGRDTARALETLIADIARAGYTGTGTAGLILLARFYKRIAGHSVNILSSVIMPLHKIDFFDESELPRQN
jgi:phosphate transport system protein